MRSRTPNVTGLGSKSHENDRGVTLSPRLLLAFDCPAHHHFRVTFSSEATMPSTWECPTCWAPAVRSDGVRSAAEPVKPVRTHGDRLHERRSAIELEDLLAERLALLRTGVIGPGVPEPVAPSRRRPVR